MSVLTTLLFDLDGVLVDAKDWHKEALNSALLEYGYRPISVDEHRNEFDGLPTKEKLNKLVQRGRLQAKDINGVSKRKQELTTKFLEERTEFNANKFCLFCGLRMMDFKIAVVSNSIKNTIYTVLDKLYITSLVDEIISNEDGKPKPAPDLYLKALSKFGSSDYNTLVFEDGHYGMQAARAAGLNKIIKIKDSSEITPTNIFRIIIHADNGFDPDGRAW